MKNDIACDSPGICLLAPTHWKVRAAALTSILVHYLVTKETWVCAKQACSQSEMCTQIGGITKGMESFDFLFGVELGRKVLNMADNLSMALRGSHCLGEYKIR